MRLRFLILFTVTNGLVLSQSQPELASFVSNGGQIHDQYNVSRKDVLFGFQSGKLVAHYRRDGFSYQLFRQHTGSDRVKDPVITSEITRVDVDFIGFESTTQLMLRDKLNGYDTYFTAGCQQGSAPVYKGRALLYQGLYKGIDLKFYTTGGTLKYDFIVAPEALVSDIKMRISGAGKVSVSAKGSLIYDTPLGVIEEGAPLAFQNDKKVECKWTIKDNIIGLETGSYDHRLPLVIDPPVRTWGTYYGGQGHDVFNALTKDKFGNVFAGGSTLASLVNIATAGAYQVSYSGTYGNDCILVKFNSAGIRLWATYYGGEGWDDCYTCKVDPSGNVYIAGSSGPPTNSTIVTSTVLATSSSHQPSICIVNNYYARDGFLAKFNTNGQRLWGTYYGFKEWDEITDCSIDTAGNIFVAGHTALQGTNEIATPGSHQTILGGSADAFLAKFDSSGVRLWGTYYGGAASDQGYGCSADIHGNVFLTGHSGSTNGIATPGAYQLTPASNQDAFIVKFNGAGQRLWGTYYGGNAIEWDHGCVTDGSGNAYLYGSTSSSAGIASTGSHQFLSGGLSDGYLARFSPTGQLNWGTYYGGTDGDIITSVFADGSELFIAGNAGTNTSNSVIATPGSYQPAYTGTMAGQTFLARFSNTGVRQWSTYYGGNVSTQGAGVMSAPGGIIYLFGNTSSYSATAVVTPGAHQTILGGGADAYLTQFVDCQLFSVSMVISTQSLCAGTSVTLTAIGADSYTWSNGSTGTVIVVTPSVSSSYTVTGTSNACSLTATDTRSVLVKPSPVIGLNDGSICRNESFTISPTGSMNYTVSGGSFIVSPSVTTVYSVSSTGSNGCVGTNTCVVTVNPLPVITISSSQPMICVGDSALLTASGATYYFWNTGAPTHTVFVKPSSSSQFTVTGTDSLRCTGTATFLQHVNECVGVAEFMMPGVKIFPNPANGLVQVILVDDAALSVYDASGRLVLEQKLSGGQNFVDLRGKAAGVYFMKFSSGKTSAEFRILVE